MWKRSATGSAKRGATAPLPRLQPLSEPESRWLSEEIKRFKPQLIISVHAPFGVLDFDGPVDPPVRFGALRPRLSACIRVRSVPTAAIRCRC
jgi:hypothetical protein